MPYYMDTSALVKLVILAPESRSLHGWATQQDRVLVSSDLARTELLRAVRRSAPDRAVQAQTVLDMVTVVRLSTAVFQAAGRIEPVTVRSLDALHLASALELGDELEGLVTYDERLAEAATLYGVAVVAPS